MQNLLTHKKWILFIALLIILGIAAPVLADYLGPNRTVTTTVSVCQAVLYECKEVNGHWKYKRMQDWSCPNSGDACAGYPSNSRPCSDESNVPGWEYCKKEESTQTTTITHPPATISGSLQNCTLQNGWCVSPPNLSLSANEPLAGYGILLIEGTLNGTSFACQNGVTSCIVPFNEGENNFNYWALSSWGDSSLMGTSSARVDTVAPNVGLDISGVSGANGWYVSPLTITATGADATSGVASTLLSIDGGATWQPALILNEGVYNAVVTVADNAGNVSNSSATLSVDTTTPAINMSVSGTAGKNGWYKSAIQVSALASDATSGVATFEVSADGAAYQSYTPIAFNDGPHTIQFKAVDAAGNVTETAPQTFSVDTLVPTVNLPTSWQLGTNVPYDVIDEGSGLAALRIVIEDEDEKYAKVAWDQEVSGSTYSQDINWNGEFKDKTVAPPGTYLVWLKASDLAGNERFQLGKVIVPQPNVFLNLLPTEEPAISASPVPPAELFEPDEAASLTTPPTVDFGGGTTQPGEATTQSVLLATGSAGAASTTTTSGILWGAAAAAAISAATAYALDATRKRKEAEPAQGKAERAEKHLSKSEKAERAREHDEKVKERKERQSWANPAKEKELLRQQKERNQAYQELLQQQAQAQAAANARMAERLAQREAQGKANWVMAPGWVTGHTPPSQQKKQEQAASNAHIEKKMAQLEANWVAPQVAIQKKDEEKKAETKKAAEMQAKLANYRAEKQAPPSAPTNWWEKTKSFVKDKIIDPMNASVVQPYIKPAIETVNEKVVQPYVVPYVEKQIEDVKKTAAWVNEKVIQPYVKPYVEAEIQKAKKTIEVVNEKVIQPYVKPYVEAEIQKAKKLVEVVNEKVIQPYVKPYVEAEIQKAKKLVEAVNEKVVQPYIVPALSAINENVIQPYVKPLVDKAANQINKVTTWVDQKIYQPVFAPVVNDINKYIYQPLAEKTSDAWDKYGEWVHGSLDVAGFIPGFGEIADGLNGLIYLGEGRYIEATVSALAMIPIVGDLGKAGKWGLKLGKEVAEEVAEKVVKEVVEEAAERVAKEATEEVIEKAARETAEEATEKAAKEQAKLIESVNQQLSKDFDDILPEGVKPIDPSKVDFKPASDFKPRVYGYYDPTTGRLSINAGSRGIPETVIHEGLHSITDNGVVIDASGRMIQQIGLEMQYLNPVTGEPAVILFRSLNEGVTEMFTREVAQHMGIKNITKAYEAQVEVAEALFEAIGSDTLKTVYFMSDTPGLRAVVDARLGEGALDLIDDALRFDDKDRALDIILNGIK